MTHNPIVENSLEKGDPSKAYPLRPMAVRKRAAARLASVQVGYSAEVTTQPLQEAIPAFLDNYAKDVTRQLRVKKMDEGHFQTVVLGVDSRKAELDRLIAASLSEGWSIARLARTELVILRAGILELESMPHIPARAVLSEYAILADAFNADVGFVNALLDRIARKLRSVEMSAPEKVD